MVDIRVRNQDSNVVTQSNNVNAIDLPDNVASNVSLNVAPEDVASYARQGDDLIVQLANGETITIADFFLQPGGETNRLYLGEDEPLFRANVIGGAILGHGSGGVVLSRAA
ncbi:BapA/Bap/LapF family prefix-like domain-containing protein [Yoonia sp. R2-816]|uniref:BapA/Bap/LapF family prefix-like domain-containing protein n=1 Tax=Yoonia sp. R2-816 TaxID=3342638 RepID=UPI0037284F58